MPTEGQTATGPNGERAVYRGGQWVVAPQQPQMPADPRFPYEGAQAQAQAANTGAQAQVNQATIQDQIRTAAAQATAAERAAQTSGLAEGQMWGQDGRTAVPIPGYTRQGLSPEVRATAVQAFTDAEALERIASDLEKQYGEDFSGSGLGSLGEYSWFGLNPTAGRFNDTADQARGYVKRALGFTGGEGNTIGEIQLNYGPYLPQAGDQDARIESKIAALRNLAGDARSRATAVLGGAPDANGNIVPIQPSALNAPRFIGPQGGDAAEFGATRGVDPPPPELVAEHDAMLQQLLQQGGGRLDPTAYAAASAALANKYNWDADPNAEAWATDLNRYLDEGGTSIPTGLAGKERELSQQEQNRNNLVSNPFGAAAVGFADMGGFGGVSALAPEQMAALSEANPTAMTLGQIGGAVTGTAGLAKLGANTIGRVAPRTLAGGGGAQFARNLATDATYGGIYGGVAQGDPLAGAGLGVLGSAGGQLFGKGLGRAVGGLDVSPAVQALKARGIQMTVPQQLGGFVRNVEDKAISIPLVGDMIRARRMGGFDDFNREAFQEAGAPVGASVPGTGQEGLEQLGDRVSDAYGNATAGVRVPLDEQFLGDFQTAVGRGQNLPPDLRRSLGEILDARVQPIADTGEMTGDQFQQAIRALKATRTRPPSRFEGFEQDYRDSVTGVMDALEGPMMRGGGEQTVGGLSTANAANRNLRTIEDAATRAAGGSETGTPFVFTPSQLQRAGLATEKRYPGARPFADLADAGQQVLPSRIPNSGTADRAAQMLLPGVIGGGAGLGALAGGDVQGAGTGAGITTLGMLALLAGGTKTGQRALSRALIDRPASMRALGQTVRRRAGLFGHAAQPFLVPDY